MQVDSREGSCSVGEGRMSLTLILIYVALVYAFISGLLWVITHVTQRGPSYIPSGASFIFAVMWPIAVYDGAMRILRQINRRR